MRAGFALGVAALVPSHSRSSSLRTTSVIRTPSAAHLVLNRVCKSGGTLTGNFFIFGIFMAVILKQLGDLPFEHVGRVAMALEEKAVSDF
jgi:hypothetical protein